MRPIFFICLLILVVGAYAAVKDFSSGPIKRVRFTKWGPGPNDKRVEHLEAEIHPKHLKTKRTNFPHSGSLNKAFLAVKGPGDERGHIIASQFSGPVKWYNLTPQHATLNRFSFFFLVPPA